MNSGRKTIAITGAEGTVGKALTTHLRDRYDIVGIDLPDIDILEQKDKFQQAITGADAVIHLAGVFGPADEGKESWKSPYRDPTNTHLFEAALQGAEKAGVPKFIHASSIHVEDTRGFLQNQSGLLTPVPRVFSTEPSSGYGQSKREQEAMLSAKASAFPGGAISLRLGGVRPDNSPLRSHEDPIVLDHEQRVWLEHGDLADLVGRIIEYEQPTDYDIVYAVSHNNGRIHDTTNKYGWEPKANSTNGLY